MKPKKLNNKLTLNKNTISNLLMDDAKGGRPKETGTVCGVSWCYPCHTYEPVAICLTELYCI